MYNTYVYPEQATSVSAYPPSGADQTTSVGGTEDFFAQAQAAFQQGDLRSALRLAGHAAVDNPRDPKIHLLLMQTMLGLNDFRGAAMEGHMVAASGQIPDWAALFGLYGNLDAFTNQLRVLENHVRQNPNAADARFVLGLQYMIQGHRDAAKSEFLASLKGAPQDRLAAQLLTQAGGTVPEDIARQQAQMQQQGGQQHGTGFRPGPDNAPLPGNVPGGNPSLGTPQGQGAPQTPPKR